MLLTHVLEKPILDLTVADLQGHGLAVRRLIGLVDALPRRAKEVLKELVDSMDWKTWTTCEKDDLQRAHSPSAAMLSLLTGVTDRTVRRAYEDAEILGVLTREHRSWNTNRFVLHLERLLQLAKESTAARLEQRRMQILAWRGGWRGPSGRWESPEGPIADPDANLRSVMVELDAARALPAPEWDELLADFPEGLGARVRAALEEARALVAKNGAFFHHLQAESPKHRGELAALCVAVQTLIEPTDSPALRMRRAGSWAGPLGPIWATFNQGPIEILLRDCAALLQVHGPDWRKTLYRRRFAGHVQGALAQLRARRGFCPDLTLDRATAEGAALLAAQERLQAEREAEALAQAEAEAAELEELRRAVGEAEGSIADLAARLEVLPPLAPRPEGRANDPRRREWNAARLSRRDLDDSIRTFREAARAGRFPEALSAAESAARHAAALDLAPASA